MKSWLPLQALLEGIDVRTLHERQGALLHRREVIEATACERRMKEGRVIELLHGFLEARVARHLNGKARNSSIILLVRLKSIEND